MPGKKARKRAPPNPARAPELEVECVTQLRKLEQLPQATPASALTEVELESGIQLRRFGDKVNFRQKLLNLISKLFSLVT
uniref:phorbol-12-myristate-13-acetate-induced protein 1 n=1 Tax=Ictidomys tridecemlineatus TaxID=43179 RepID=UPI001A9F8301|nr:phorbol-12-myristate-13-acetate-induced protein 1 [Ictidomys tridecemlineatus]